jgi:hypothetical protein
MLSQRQCGGTFITHCAIICLKKDMKILMLLLVARHGEASYPGLSFLWNVMGA